MNSNNKFSGLQLFLIFLILLSFAGGITSLCFELPIICAGCFGSVMIFYSILFLSEFKKSNILSEEAGSSEDSDGSGQEGLKAKYNDLWKNYQILSDEFENYKKNQKTIVIKETVDNNNEESLANLLPPAEDDANAEPVNIIDIAKDTMEELKLFAKKSGIEIRLTKQSDDIFVKASRERLHIMFRNIIDNSIKYMGKQGFLQITISHIEDDIFIVLKDNGYGLATDETTHIFELNYQGSNRISGNGLGLTQSKAIVNYYGGTIYARSNKGNGMGIYIQLPTS